MHPRITELLAHLDRERQALREAVDTVPPEAREERRWPDRWSVAEILEHLGIVERQLTHLVKSAVGNARAKGLRREEETSPIMWTVPMQVFVDRTRHITASSTVLPTGTMDAETAWQRLEGTRASLRGALLDADGLALGDVVYPHPVVGNLNLYQWIGFIGAHEARHADQIRELARAGAHES
jgi:hypothetical protein